MQFHSLSLAMFLSLNSTLILIFLLSLGIANVCLASLFPSFTFHLCHWICGDIFVNNMVESSFFSIHCSNLGLFIGEFPPFILNINSGIWELILLFYC